MVVRHEFHVWIGTEREHGGNKCKNSTIIIIIIEVPQKLIKQGVEGGWKGVARGGRLKIGTKRGDGTRRTRWGGWIERWFWDSSVGSSASTCVLLSPPSLALATIATLRRRTFVRTCFWKKIN